MTKRTMQVKDMAMWTGLFRQANRKAKIGFEIVIAGQTAIVSDVRPALTPSGNPSRAIVRLCVDGEEAFYKSSYDFLLAKPDADFPFVVLNDGTQTSAHRHE